MNNQLEDYDEILKKKKYYDKLLLEVTTGILSIDSFTNKERHLISIAMNDAMSSDRPILECLHRASKEYYNKLRLEELLEV